MKSKPMKNIAIVIDSLTGGGAERVMISLATEMTRQGHKVTLLSLSNRCDYFVPNDISVANLFDHKASKVDRFWHIKSSIIKLESWFAKQHTAFDLILSNLDRSNNLLAKSKISPVYYVIHNSVEEELARQKKLGPLAYLYLKKSKQNLTGKNLIKVSKGIEQEVIQGNTIIPKTIRTIYNPFDLKTIQQNACKADKHIPQVPFIIHVGRLAKQKRHDVLFAALSKVNENIKLVLLCNKPKKALKLAKKYGVAQRLILPGFQENPYNWIKQAKALVLSSDYEGFGNVLLEAIAVGTPVVSTDCPHGPNEILTGELARFLVPRQSPEALAEKINEAITTEVTLGEADILKAVDSTKIAEQYLQLAKS